MNKVILIGRIVNDTRTYVTTSSVKYARNTIAVRRRGSSGSNEDLTDFIPITAWRNTADVLEKYAPKGTLVAVEGSLRVSQYTKNNEIVRSYDVNVDNLTLLESRQMREQRENNNESTQPQFSDKPRRTETENEKIKPSFSSDDVEHNFAFDIED